MTLRNDRGPVPAAGDFVRNGECWCVVGRDSSGGLEVTSLDGRGRVALPAAYVREHVALAYALTVHKAQGQTVDRALVLVDAQMTVQQLYVAMSRGREENRAFAQRTPSALAEHVFAQIHEQTTLEVLAEVTRRDGAERSAHSVLRANLDRMEDLDLLRHLRAEGRRQLKDEAGPDRAAEIARLELRADVARARAQLIEAHETVRRAAEDRRAAELLLDETGARPGRTLLPSHFGHDAHAQAEFAKRSAEDALSSARRGEQRAMRTAAAARHDFEVADRAAHQLAQFRIEQHGRDACLRAHPDAERLVLELEARIRSIERELEPSRYPRPQGEQLHPNSRSVLPMTPSARSSSVSGAVELVDRFRRPRSQSIRAVGTAPRSWTRGRTRSRHGSSPASAHFASNRSPTTRLARSRTRPTAPHARDEAARHRAEAERLRARGETLAEQASVDYFGARDDGRIIEAGAGRLHLRTVAVAEAAARRAAIVSHCDEQQLPRSGWSDDAVRDRAGAAVRRIVEPAVRDHHVEAQRSVEEAASFEAEITVREQRHDNALRANGRVVGARQALRDEVESDRAARVELIDRMSAEEVARADAARDARRNDHERVRSHGQDRGLESPELSRPSPHIVGGGPGLGR